MSNDKELYELGDVSPKLFFTEEELKSHGIVACNFSPKMYEVDWDKVGLEEMKDILKVCSIIKVAEGSTEHELLEHVLKPSKN